LKHIILAPSGCLIAVEETDPTKQGLKQNLSVSVISQERVEETDPTKQGLKHAIPGADVVYFCVEETDPTKQGLKPSW